MPAKSLPGIPLVQFGGSNSREKYTSDAGSLIGKGYDTVRTIPSSRPLYSSVISNHFDSTEDMGNRFAYGIS